MFNLPGTFQAIAASIAGAIGIAWWWLRGAPGRKEKKFRKQLSDINSALAKAEMDHDEEKYNQLMADRKRLLDSWVR